MNKALLFSFFLNIFLVPNIHSQYTEIINTNKPGSSQGAFSVGKNILQFENAAYFSETSHNIINYESEQTGLDFSVRFGAFLEKLELNIDGNFQMEKIDDLRYVPVRKSEVSNFKFLRIGAKYLVYDPKKGLEDKPNYYSYWADKKFSFKNLIPAVSIYSAINIDSENNPYTAYGVKGISPTISIILQSNFSKRSVLICNLIGDRIGSKQNDYGYILSLTHAFTGRFISYIENQAIISDFYADNKIALGVAYLINKNIQLDIGSSLNFKTTPKIFTLSFGYSHRFNLNSKE